MFKTREVPGRPGRVGHPPAIPLSLTLPSRPGLAFRWVGLSFLGLRKYRSCLWTALCLALGTAAFPGPLLSASMSLLSVALVTPLSHVAHHQHSSHPSELITGSMTLSNHLITPVLCHWLQEGRAYVCLVYLCTYRKKVLEDQRRDVVRKGSQRHFTGVSGNTALPEDPRKGYQESLQQKTHLRN